MAKISPINKQPKLTSLSVAFKRATTLTEDVTEAKKEHRSNLKILAEKYMADVAEGKAEGIRNAKEFVEVIKADMLLLGEATERTSDTNALEEVRMRKVTQVLDEVDLENGDIQSFINSVLMAMNDANDESDTNPSKSMDSVMVEVEDIEEEDSSDEAIVEDSDAIEGEGHE